MDAATPMDAPPRAIERARERVSAADLAAAGAFAVSLVVYVRTLLPGVSFGDWAEAEMIPSRLGILHPTGYPLYSLIGTLFSLIPVGSVAYRANLLSAVAAAGAVAVMVLIAVRLGVRPVVAFAAGLALAFTGTVWQEATFSEMNGLHVFIVALLLHRALVWREERRDRDLLLGALLGGLCVSNHGLAITVVPIVILFVLADARREIKARPMLLVKAGAVFALGLLPYLWLPLRALAGPAEAYGPFLTLEGLFAHISGAQFRGDMHFTSIESVQAAWAALPQVSDHLLASWLILGIGLAYAGETLVEVVVARTGPRLAWVAFAMLILPAILVTSNWASHDQSANRDGERFTAEVFAALPPDSVLLTYWDALTPLSYEHCVEGVRPDVSLRAYDEKALVTCDPVERPLTDVVRRRPVYALLVNDSTIKQMTGLTPVPVQPFMLPWGQRYPELARTLYRLVPADQAP